jgi:hypothetical protein
MAVEEEWARGPGGGLRAGARHRLQGAGGAVMRVPTSEREMEVEVRSCYFESVNLSKTGLRSGLRKWEAIQLS